MSAHSSRAHLWLLALAAVLLLLRLPLAAMPALWIDEAFSMYHARLPLAQLWGEGWQLESSPPLYYTVLWVWLRLVGDSELSARILSLLLTVAAAGFLYRAGRVLAGPTAGAAAMLVWLLPALGLEFSLEIRPYALQQLWIAMALWSFVSLVSAQIQQRPPANTGGAGLLKACLLFSSVATFYTHTTSLAFLGGLAAAGVYAGWTRRAGWRYWRAYLGLSLTAIVLSLPQAFVAVGVLASNRAGLAWIPSSLEPGVVFQVLRQWALGMQWWRLEVSGPLTILIIVVLGACIWRQRQRVELVAVGLVMTLAATLLLVVAGIVQSVLLPRTALWLWLPLALVVGCTAVSMHWNNGVWRHWAAGGFVLLLLTTSLFYAFARPSERSWYYSISAIEDRVQPGERLLFMDPEIACVLDQYAGKKLAVLPRLQLELGREQRFRSGQRLNIVCNQLPVVEAAGVAADGVRADWILLDGTQQRADFASMLQRANPAIKPTETVSPVGPTQATRVVKVNPSQ